MSSAALVPERRFPGFVEPWAYEPLSRVLREHKIKNGAGRDVFSVSMESGIVNQIEHLGRSFAAADTSHYNIGHRFDVVYTKSPLKAFPFGIVKQCKAADEVALSPLYGVFTPKNPHLGLMIEAYFEAPERAQAFLAPLCQKGAKNTLQITNATFLSGRMPLPQEEGEQRQIAECLASVDALIAAQGRKVEALKAHKKGLTQQLFPQDGRTQPRLRFPEFEGAGDWDFTTLGSVANISSGTTPSRSNSEYFERGDIPWVKTGDLNNSSIKDTEERVTSIARVRVNPIGSVLIAMYGGFNQIGRTGYLAVPAATNQAISVLVVDRTTILPTYVLAWLNAMVGRWRRIASSSRKDPNITGSDVAAFPICMPKLPEQQRISDCLASLDDLIASEARKLDTLKAYKKGLMQQLFPSVLGANA